MDSELVAILLAQFQSGKINSKQLTESLYREKEKEIQRFNILETNLKCQQNTIDEYAIAVNKCLIDTQEIRNKLTDMTADRDKWKEKYEKYVQVKEMSLLTAIQIARKGKFGKLNVVYNSSYAVYDPSQDKEAQIYITARSYILKYHPFVEKILLFIKYI